MSDHNGHIIKKEKSYKNVLDEICRKTLNGGQIYKSRRALNFFREILERILGHISGLCS